MSATPTTCPHCGAPDKMECVSWQGGRRSACYELQISQLKSHLKEVSEAGQNLLNLYVRLVNSGDAGNRNPETEPEVIRMRESLTDINATLSSGNLEAEPEALPDTHADRLPEQRAPDGDSSDPAGKA